MNFNKDMLIKNISAILCGLIIVALLLPFASITATTSVMGYSGEGESESFSGFTFIFGSGIAGIVLGIIPLIILASCYISQLNAYKKYISLGASVLGIILLFVVPGQYSVSGSAEAEGVSASMEISAKYQIGFWLILVLYVIQIAIAVIQFFNLKGNKVFDTINSGDVPNEGSEGAGIPKLNMEKISNLAGNISDTIKNTASGISASHSSGQQTAGQPSVTPASQNTVTNNASANSPIRTTDQAISMSDPQPAIRHENSKESMDQNMELIEKFFKMKEAGILTEEEFTDKKKELLEKISSQI